MNLGVWGITLDDSLKAKEVINKYIGECEGYKKQVLYYNPTTQTWEKPILREWDSIEKHSDGKYYYHKRSEEVVLNGSENWQNENKPLETTDLYSLANGIPNAQYKSKIVINIADFTEENYANYDKVGFYRFSAIDYANNAVIRILKSANIQQWLQTNPVTVVYQLAKEEVYECTNLDLITYSGVTHLIVNSGAIQPRITLKVLSNVSNVVKLLQEKVSVLENKFINGLKQVLAGDMMSLAHLLYPEDFENNHEIQTLEL